MSLLPVNFPRRLRHEVVRLCVYAILAYTAILVYIVLTEDRQVFPAAYDARPDHTPALPAEFQRVDLLTSDGEHLVAHETPSSGNPDQRRWCIFFGGQWGRTRWDLPKLALLRELGCEVLIFDYRGFGDSTGKATETGFYRDADAAYRYLIETKHVPPARIVLVAHSLGTGIAIDLASRSLVGGLILDGAYDSIPSCAADRYPWLPVRWLAHNRFASIDKVARISAPKLFLHGEFDESIPIQHGRAVFARAVEPKKFLALEGRHEDFQWSDPDRFKLAVSEFIAHLPP